MPIERIRPDGLVHSPAFSHVAVVPPGATTIYVGGQNSVDADGALVGGDDVAAQSIRALQNVKTALAAAGASIDDVVQWTVLFVDGVDIGSSVRSDRVRARHRGAGAGDRGPRGRSRGARRARRDRRGCGEDRLTLDPGPAARHLPRQLP